MAFSASRLDELARQKARLETDFMSRMLGVVLTCTLFSVYLPARVVVELYVLIIATEIGNAFLFSQIDKRPRYLPLIYIGINLNAWAGMCAFSFLGTLIWGISDPLVKITGALSLVGGLISVSTSRAEHLPFGIISGIPPAVALIWITGRGWNEEQGFGQSAFAMIAVIGLIGYFSSALVQNHVTQTRLAQALKRANAASRAKSHFLSEMNHEMRTPLNTILGLSRTLIGPASREDVAHRATEIEGAARALQMLVEDVLDLAAAEEGEIVHRPVTTVIRHEMSAVARVLSGACASDGDVVAVSIADDVPELGRIDPLLLRKCLLKLAKMFAAPGDDRPCAPMRLSCAAACGDVPRLRIALALADHPPVAGETAKDHVLLGELVNRLAATMGATLTLGQTKGVLQSAELSLPYVPVPDLPARAAPDAARHLRALVVDDLSTNRFVVAQMLKTLAIDPIEAESGASALDALSKGSYDLVLLDMNMPAMNGEETYRAIRSSAQPWASVPIIALTADAQAEQRERYLALGIDGYVAKPVDNRLLWAEIVACVPNVGAPPA